MARLRRVAEHRSHFGSVAPRTARRVVLDRDVDHHGPEMVRSAGHPAARLGHASGWAFFWLLFFAHAKKSDAVWLQAKIYPARVAQIIKPARQAQITRGI